MKARRTCSVPLPRVGLALAVLGVCLAGCAGLRRDFGAMSAEYAPTPAAREETLDLVTEAPAAQPAKPAESGAASRASLATTSPASGGTRDGVPPATQPERRLRVYSGFLELVVNEIEKARERIVETTGQMGGYVEQTTAEYVVVRVPAAKLEEAMEEFSKVGEVRARSVETTDVTESHADLQRRIEIAKRTRDRLYVLLDKTTDVEERVRILREIRRLTEEIEQMSAALTLLEGQILLSRVSVHLLSRMDDSAGAARSIPFPWIAGLSPLRPSTRASASEIDAAVPSEYAVFESGKRLRLEAADGTRVAVGVVTNEPRGDTAFWRDALLYHLRDLYRGADPVAAGGFEGAVFESKDIQPFLYLVAVMGKGEELLVAEAFFPDAGARERRLAGVVSMLEGLKP